MALRLPVSAIALLVSAAVCGRSAPPHAGKLRKLWDVDLRKQVRRSDGDPEFPVFALKFSPDGRKLAIIADVYERGEGKKSRLLVADVNHPDVGILQFESEFGLIGSGVGALNFGWTPSGQIIYALGRVIHLNGGADCELPGASAFISDDIAVSARSYPPSVYSSTQVTFFDRNCEERGRWEVPEWWLISDVSTDRHLLSIVREDAARRPGHSERLIVDPVERRVLERWRQNDTSSWVWEFADNGKVVCGGGRPLGSRVAPAICRSVDTGKEIAEPPGSNGVEPIATAAQATRAIVSDYRPSRVPWGADELPGTFKGRAVWDFGTNQLIASWHPATATYGDVFHPGKQITASFQFAMSPDGQYVVEGGNGIIRFYKIEP